MAAKIRSESVRKQASTIVGKRWRDKACGVAEGGDRGAPRAENPVEPSNMSFVSPIANVKSPSAARSH